MSAKKCQALKNVICTNTQTQEVKDERKKGRKFASLRTLQIAADNHL
jgi:hypothetical protein